jgi:hypothetical protein
METIELSAHVGQDGLLRIEVPVADRNRDVRVSLIVHPAAQGAPSSSAQGVGAAPIETIRAPLAGSWNREPVSMLEPKAAGPSTSELLVGDRR